MTNFMMTMSLWINRYIALYMIIRARAYRKWWERHSKCHRGCDDEKTYRISHFLLRKSKRVPQKFYAFGYRRDIKLKISQASPVENHLAEIISKVPRLCEPFHLNVYILVASNFQPIPSHWVRLFAAASVCYIELPIYRLLPKKETEIFVPSEMSILLYFIFRYWISYSSLTWESLYRILKSIIICYS